MRIERRKTPFLALLLCLALLSCSEEKGQGPVIHDADLTLPLRTDTWTYVSLETGIIVAEIAFADSLAQKDMANRTDWDIAYAPDGLIRTNNAPSGSGQAAIGISNTDFAATDILAPFSDLTEDDAHTAIW